jgi:hypothetical protein
MSALKPYVIRYIVTSLHRIGLTIQRFSGLTSDFV